MWKPCWPLALPLALALLGVPGSARASTIHDLAKMFSPDAVQKAEAELNRIERANQVPINIETIPSLNGENVVDVAEDRARQSNSRGLYIFMAKQEHKFEILVARPYSGAISIARRRSIRDAFMGEFKAGDFDSGLLQGVKAIGTEVSAARAEQGAVRRGVPAPIPGRAGMPGRRGNPQGAFGLSSLLGIALLIVGVLFVVRLLGSIFGGGYTPGPMGGRSYGPGYGGAGGGGGGFMSGLFGGLGGALAGNWLYDQFSGRHHGGYTDSSTYGGDAGASSQGDDWSGGAGGDWGGGDSGGGGDWGGGGGDWGGGGGDVGGGDW